MKAKKSLGQNFLKQEKYISELVLAAAISPNDTVLEIGPGLGVITEKLAKTAGRVLAVEFDRDLIPFLQKNLSPFRNVEIVNDDILRFLNSNFQPACAGRLPTSNFKLVGSLPYQITSPLLHQLADLAGWSAAAFLVQKEVAEKITAAPPRATYLSNFVKAWAGVKLVAVVPKEAFFPMPKVDGMIIKMTPETPRIDPKSWSTFLHHGFAHPRQMINKALPVDILGKAQIDPCRRPATLTLEEWLKVYNLWKN